MRSLAAAVVAADRRLEAERRARARRRPRAGPASSATSRQGAVAIPSDGHEAALGQPVLGHPQGAGAGPNRDAGGLDGIDERRVDVLQLVRDDRAAAGQLDRAVDRVVRRARRRGRRSARPGSPGRDPGRRSGSPWPGPRTPASVRAARRRGCRSWRRGAMGAGDRVLVMATGVYEGRTAAAARRSSLSGRLAGRPADPASAAATWPEVRCQHAGGALRSRPGRSPPRPEARVASAMESPEPPHDTDDRADLLDRLPRLHRRSCCSWTCSCSIGTRTS